MTVLSYLGHLVGVMTMSSQKGIWFCMGMYLG